MKIGILGGIGVEATGRFYLDVVHRLQRGGQINSNVDFPQMIINSIPAPELHLDIDDRPDVLDPYINGIKQLLSHEPDFIVMVCNTIHLFMDKIISDTGYSNILPLRKVVEKSIRRANSKSICVLGTGLTVERGLYKYSSEKYVDLNSNELERVCFAVSELNSHGADSHHGKAAKRYLRNLVRKKVASGVDTFILACTEVSEALDGMSLDDVKFIDTFETLVAETVKLASSKEERRPSSQASLNTTAAGELATHNAEVLLS